MSRVTHNQPGLPMDRHDRVQTESQQLQPRTAVSTLLGKVIK